MDAEFWKSRWREGQIGFHLEAPNPRLVAHGSFLSAARRVLVPLCGKSNDLAVLDGGGHEVIGIELSPIAAEAYFAAHGLTAERTRVGAFEHLRSGRTSIFVGDFFACTSETIGGTCDGFYDRAALVALPPEMRGDYVRTMRGLLSPNGNGLLVSLEFDAPGGPPHSVDDAEVRRHFADARLEELSCDEVTSDAPRIRERGATRVVERTYGIRWSR